MSALTKMFVVLQLVFSLFLAVLLTLMVSKQQNYRDVATSAHDSAVISAAQVAADKGQLATIQTQDQNARICSTTPTPSSPTPRLRPSNFRAILTPPRPRPPAPPNPPRSNTII